ncbi:MAG: hypothetical protein C0439_04270 [Pseudomonas sp.]|nr:hypothetical protein [Pseudomonas sp.]
MNNQIQTASENKSNEMISRLKNLLNLQLTKQLRITIMSVISVATVLLEKNPEQAEKYLMIFFDLFMSLESEIQEKELIEKATTNQPRNLSLFTEINHDSALATWENFISAFEKEQQKLNNSFSNKLK